MQYKVYGYNIVPSSAVAGDLSAVDIREAVCVWKTSNEPANKCNEATFTLTVNPHATRMREATVDSTVFKSNVQTIDFRFTKRVCRRMISIRASSALKLLLFQSEVAR